MPIPIGPKPPKPDNPAPPSGGGETGKGGGKGAGGGGGNSVQAEIARQRREAAAAKRKAAERYLGQARTLQHQVDALRKALGPKGIRTALEVRLSNIGRLQGQADELLLDDYTTRVEALGGAATDNAKAAAAQGYASLSNRGRERLNALSEVAAQGGGESDMLRAQEASLRNWNANQSEVNRNFYDTLRTVNSSLTDLTIDTRTARVNNVVEANADREQQWAGFFDSRSEIYTQLGNVLGQQSEYYGLAQEQDAKGAGKKKKRADKLSGQAFDNATESSSSAWKNRGAPKRLLKWDGAAAFEGRQQVGQLNASTSMSSAGRGPEGSTIKQWKGDEA